jgi:hypothetical protein
MILATGLVTGMRQTSVLPHGETGNVWASAGRRSLLRTTVKRDTF